MIFATCGSSHFPFQRMMASLAELPPDELHLQHGPAEPPICAASYPFLSLDEIVEQIGLADVVVTHAGVGSILCALRSGHTPIVFPRLKRYSEAVDDHQAELADALAERGTVLVARTPDELLGAIASVPTRQTVVGRSTSPLTQAVRATILGAPLAVTVEALADHPGFAGQIA